MPGTPKKRARRAERELERARILADFPVSEIPDAIPAPEGEPAPRADRPRLRPRAQPGPGASTRATVDQLESAEIAQLAAALRPGVTLVIERTRPEWCAGWIEDYHVSRGDISDLRAHIADEHGGQIYKITPTGAGGMSYFTAELKIAGQPRRNGRPVTRDDWEGIGRPAPAPAAHVAGDATITTLGNIFRTMIEQTQQSNDRQFKALESMVKAQSETTEKLVSTIVRTRAESENKTSLTGAIRDLVKANEAMQEARDAFTSTGPAPAEPADEKNLLARAAEGAAQEFLTSVMAAKIGPKRAPATSPIPPPPSVDLRSGIRNAVTDPDEKH